VLDDAEWRLRKAKSLVKLLALAPGHRLHREQVMDLLWSDLDAEAAANNLHKTLYVARRTLEPDLPPSTASSYLHLQGDLVTLRARGELWIDVDEFEAAANAARRSRDPARYESAVELYVGDLLPEDRYEEWAVGRREVLAAGYLGLLIELAQLHEQLGHVEAAVAALRETVAREPAHEEAHRLLMSLYAHAGQRHQALRQYQQLRQALERELDAEPEAESERLYQEILAGRFPPAPAPRLGAGLVASPSRAAAHDAVLVGRDRELDDLEDVLERLFAGDGQLIFVAGEAGVGKTRLCREVAERIRRRGGTALVGAGYEQEGRLPYGPFVEAFQQLAGSTSAGELRSLLGKTDQELGRLIPSAAPGQRVGGGTGDRQRFFAAVGNLLRKLAEASPVLLVLDDLHAADEASFQLLHYLARTLKDAPVLILSTHRPEEAGPTTSLGQLLAALTRERLCSSIELGRLSARQSDVLVGSLLGEAPVERTVFDAVHELAAGNPFYTEEALRSLRESGQLEQVDGRWRVTGQVSPVPAQLAQLVVARIERLDPRARAALNLAAVAGREVPYRVLRAAADLSEPELLDALDICLAGRVLDEAADGYRFNHPVHRAALYERLSRARRATLHGRVAAALETLYADGLEAQTEALAYHHLRSEVPGQAVPHLIAAGDRAAAVHANEAAVEAYQRAIELLGTTGAPEAAPALLAELSEKLGDRYSLMGETGRELAAYASAIGSLSGADDMAKLPRLHRKAAHACLAQHDADLAESHLDEVDRVLADRPDDAERGRVLRVRAHWQWERGSYEAGVRAAEEALALAEQHGEVADTIAAYSTLALVFHSHGDWQRGLHFVIDHLGDVSDAPQLAELCDAYL